MLEAAPAALAVRSLLQWRQTPRRFSGESSPPSATGTMCSTCSERPVQRGLQHALRIAPQNHVAKSLNFLVPGAPRRRGSAPAVFVAIRHAAVDAVNAVQLTAELAPFF
jgi:hypothetical protein